MVLVGGFVDTEAAAARVADAVCIVDAGVTETACAARAGGTTRTRRRASVAGGVAAGAAGRPAVA